MAGTASKVNKAGGIETTSCVQLEQSLPTVALLAKANILLVSLGDLHGIG